MSDAARPKTVLNLTIAGLPWEVSRAMPSPGKPGDEGPHVVVAVDGRAIFSGRLDVINAATPNPAAGASGGLVLIAVDDPAERAPRAGGPQAPSSPPASGSGEGGSGGSACGPN